MSQDGISRDAPSSTLEMAPHQPDTGVCMGDGDGKSSISNLRQRLQHGLARMFLCGLLGPQARDQSACNDACLGVRVADNLSRSRAAVNCAPPDAALAVASSAVLPCTAFPDCGPKLPVAELHGAKIINCAHPAAEQSYQPLAAFAQPQQARSFSVGHTATASPKDPATASPAAPYQLLPDAALDSDSILIQIPPPTAPSKQSGHASRPSSWRSRLSATSISAHTPDREPAPPTQPPSAALLAAISILPSRHPLLRSGTDPDIESTSTGHPSGRGGSPTPLPVLPEHAVTQRTISGSRLLSRRASARLLRAPSGRLLLSDGLAAPQAPLGSSAAGLPTSPAAAATNYPCPARSCSSSSCTRSGMYREGTPSFVPQDMQPLASGVHGITSSNLASSTSNVRLASTCNAALLAMGIGMGTGMGLPAAAGPMAYDTHPLHGATLPSTGQVSAEAAEQVAIGAPSLDPMALGCQLTLQMRLGQGAHGLVYKGLWNGSGVAVKFMAAVCLESFRSQLTELLLCKALSHPNLIQTYACNVWLISASTLNVCELLLRTSTSASSARREASAVQGSQLASPRFNPFNSPLGSTAGGQPGSCMQLDALPFSPVQSGKPGTNQPLLSSDVITLMAAIGGLSSAPAPTLGMRRIATHTCALSSLNGEGPAAAPFRGCGMVGLLVSARPAARRRSSGAAAAQGLPPLPQAAGGARTGPEYVCPGSPFSMGSGLQVVQVLATPQGNSVVKQATAVPHSSSLRRASAATMLERLTIAGGSVSGAATGPPPVCTRASSSVTFGRTAVLGCSAAAAAAAGNGPTGLSGLLGTRDMDELLADEEGARRIAEAVRALCLREGQVLVQIVMEECDRGSLQQLLNRAAKHFQEHQQPPTTTTAKITQLPAPGPLDPAPQLALPKRDAAAGFPSLVASQWCAVPPAPASAPPPLYAPFLSSGRWAEGQAVYALVLTAKEVALGLAFLHSHNVIHGDLKPGNVLLRSSRADLRGWVAKVSDLGLGKVLHTSRQQPSGAGIEVLSSGQSATPNRGGMQGTLAYLAPEVLDGSQDTSADVYSYGVLLWQLVTGRRPYDGMRPAQILAFLSTCPACPLEWPPGAHPTLLQLGRACTEFDPQRRPAFAQVVRALMALEAELKPPAAS